MHTPAATVSHLTPAAVPSKEEWKALLALAKTHRSTLGFLPDSAFSDRLRRGTLAVAHLDGLLVGYCLYDRPRGGHIKLVHVCVTDSVRRLRVGQSLVESVIAENKDASGIVAHCRRDYTGVDRFWQTLGMTPRGERAGRAVQGSTLSAWWRPLGQLDLFEGAALTGGLPLVVYDTNIVSDLYASPKADRPDRGASIGLLAGWLQAAITPAVSPRVDIELHRIEDEDERVRQMNASQELVRLRSSHSQTAATLERLRTNVDKAALATDSSLEDDLKHLADAVTAGASYLVTNDENFLRAGREAVSAGEPLEVLRPHELVTQMLERLNGPTFRPRLIATPSLDWRPASGLSEQAVLDAFISHGNGEGASALTRLIRAALAQNPARTLVLTDERQRMWALLSDRVVGEELVVDLLRVRRGEVAGTTAFQLARHLRERALGSDVRHVRVSDPSTSMVALEALTKDGFELDGAEPVARLVSAAWDRTELQAAEDLTSDAPARELERRFWPLVLLKEDIPTYVVPIRPRYAKRLFGLHDDALWSDRKRGLGLSREHVYFSGANKALPPREARLLWYATADDTDTLQSVVAFSRSLGVKRLPPADAHAAHAHLGVFRRRDVEAAAAKDGLVAVLRFEDTSVLSESVSGDALQNVLERHGVKHPILSFRQVPPAVFDDLIQLNGALA